LTNLSIPTLANFKQAGELSSQHFTFFVTYNEAHYTRVFASPLSIMQYSKRSLKGVIPCTGHLDECMGHQATYNCIVEAQAMLVLFSLLFRVIHHALYEDYPT
jgi:hypothetical protein